MNEVRLGVVGAAGGMATTHRKYFEKIEGLRYAAASDHNPEKLAALADETGAEPFADADAMIASGKIDALLIATPHFAHPDFARKAFAAGVHVLCEKPVAVTALEAEKLNDDYADALTREPGLIFAGMFNQRDRPDWKVVKRLCTDGSIGELQRVSWTITTWFRSQRYYDSGSWRATWKGEGGGVLINQCPHNLDLFQWFVGMPSRVTANVGIGRHHHIEVEDDVTALLEFPNGATGTFVTSTGQSPGVNRLEIVGQHGTLIAEHGEITCFRAHRPVDAWVRESTDGFADVPADRLVITPGGESLEHEAITRNFVETVRAGGTQDDLIAPGTEMIHGLELGNAMLYSGLTKAPVDLPTDRAAFAAKIADLAANSTFEKPEPPEGKQSFDGTF